MSAPALVQVGDVILNISNMTRANITRNKDGSTYAVEVWFGAMGDGALDYYTLKGDDAANLLAFLRRNAAIAERAPAGGDPSVPF